jgi:hypothetical protein
VGLGWLKWQQTIELKHLSGGTKLAELTLSRTDPTPEANNEK